MLLLCLPTGCRLVKADPKTAFLGDSLTFMWAYPRANFGMWGDTTAEMLARFPASIEAGRYTKVVILGGTNDVFHGIDPNVTIRNLQKIATLAVRGGAQPVLCEIPPIFHSFIKSDHTDYSGKVRSLNERIVRLAAERKWKLADYYDPMLGHPGYSSDGVHMKRRGYAVMEWALFHAAPPP